MRTGRGTTKNLGLYDNHKLSCNVQKVSYNVSYDENLTSCRSSYIGQHKIQTFCDTLEKSPHIVIFYDAIIVIYYIVNASHYVHVVTDGTLEGFHGGAFVRLLDLSGSSCIVVTHLVTRTFCLV